MEQACQRQTWLEVQLEVTDLVMLLSLTCLYGLAAEVSMNVVMSM